MFHPIAVGVFRLIHCQLLISIFPKWSGQFWYWFIVDARFVILIDMGHKYIIFIACDFLLFAHDLFNLIARVFFNYFAHTFFDTLICLNFVIQIYLPIFIIPDFSLCGTTLALLTDSR